jgi:molecular chaperone DnaJ
MDCYVVLGVPRDASLSQIRRAYRELTHQYDPDRDDGASAAAFDDVSDSYGTLTDVGARLDHDRELAVADARDAEAQSRARDLSPPRDLFDDFEDYRPSREEVLRTFVDNFLGRLPKSRTVRPVNVDVALTADEAGEGGVVPFRVPAATACAVCDGTGRTGFFACDACDGAGVTWSLARVDAAVPRRAGPGTSVPVSLEPIGVSTLYLNVTVRAAPAI